MEIQRKIAATIQVDIKNHEQCSAHCQFYKQRQLMHKDTYCTFYQKIIHSHHRTSTCLEEFGKPSKSTVIREKISIVEERLRDFKKKKIGIDRQVCQNEEQLSRLQKELKETERKENGEKNKEATSHCDCNCPSTGR